MNRTNILISSSAKDTIKESVQLAQELNTGIEISRLPLYKSDKYTPEEVWEDIRNDLKGFNNKVTLHAMFSDINIASQDYLIREVGIRRYKESLETGKGINAEIILFHSGYKGTKHYGSIESFKKNFISFWKDFIKEFEENNITAVIENVFETGPDFCKELIEKVNSDYFKLALDCGHVNLYAHNSEITEWIKEYGDKLYHMHIHNNFEQNDDHNNLYDGTLDYKEIFNTLKEKSLNPTMVLEMFTEDDIRKSIKYLEDIEF